MSAFPPIAPRRFIRADPGGLELLRASYIRARRDAVERLTDVETEEEISRGREELAYWDAQIASLDAAIAERATA